MIFPENADLCIHSFSSEFDVTNLIHDFLLFSSLLHDLVIVHSKLICWWKQVLRHSTTGYQVCIRSSTCWSIIICWHGCRLSRIVVLLLTPSKLIGRSMSLRVFVFVYKLASSRWSVPLAWDLIVLTGDILPFLARVVELRYRLPNLAHWSFYRYASFYGRLIWISLT